MPSQYGSTLNSHRAARAPIIEHVQLCTTAQHYAAPEKDSFATKYVNFCEVGGEMRERERERLDESHSV
ncbi:hypothetical protein TNCV_143181 [Trichonephila clavipes]|nr:hypothetical protein TNCV_143181 [Trichonephila clavipes]